MKLKNVTNPNFMPGYVLLGKHDTITRRTQWIDCAGVMPWTIVSKDNPAHLGRTVGEAAGKNVICREPV